MPRPNSEAGTLQERAASRWPNSWTIIASAANPISEIISDICCNPSAKDAEPSRETSVKTYAE